MKTQEIKIREIFELIKSPAEVRVIKIDDEYIYYTYIDFPGSKSAKKVDEFFKYFKRKS
jgi:hypothetical protein